MNWPVDFLAFFSEFKKKKKKSKLFNELIISSFAFFLLGAHKASWEQISVFICFMDRKNRTKNLKSHEE